MTLRLAVSALALSAGAASAQDLPQADSQWYTDAQATIEAALARQPNTNRAKNVILMVSDGNSIASNYAIRVFTGQAEGGFGDDYVQPQEAFPNLALVKTYNINAQTPDSAPTAAAMNTGVKQRFNLLNLSEAAIAEDCSTEAGNELTTFSEIVSGDDMGKSVGIVTTARLTHATPAAVYAKTAYRDWEAGVPEGCTGSRDIATQLLDAMDAGTVDFAMGGGRQAFFPEGATDDEGDGGDRTDGTDLIQRAKDAGYQYAWNTATAGELALDGTTPVLALMEDSHMKYSHDRTDEDEPSLAEMTRMAIEYLQNDEDGFFLEIEAGRVDHANHGGNAYRMMTDGVAFADAVRMADEMTDDSDTLIVVTADHGHALTINGYCGRGSPIHGLCYDIAAEGVMHTDEAVLADDGKPYTVLGYLNGPGSVLKEQPLNPEDASQTQGQTDVGAAAQGQSDVPIFSGSRPDLTNEEATDPDYLQQALIPKSSETHSPEDVALYAKGPFAHLFDGTIEQNVIFHVMHHAVTAGD